MTLRSSALLSIFSVMQPITSESANMHYFSDSISQLFWHLPVNVSLLAQNITDPNIVGQMQKAWSHFIQTGQVWALLIGLVIGYMIRNLTSYG